MTGALLLSCIEGQPVPKKVDKKLAYDIEVSHAKLHTIKPDVQKH